MQTELYTLPAHWASALINGDLSGYEGDDLEAIRRFTASMVTTHGSCRCLDVCRDPETGNPDVGFTRWHDASHLLPFACDAASFQFDVTPCGGHYPENRDA